MIKNIAIINTDQIVGLTDLPHGLVRKEVSITYTQYDLSKCDGCGAQLIDVECGRVCPKCGLEPKENYNPLQYDRPYDDNRVQHAPLGNTQIGTTRERLCNSQSRRLESISYDKNIMSGNLIITSLDFITTQNFSFINGIDVFSILRIYLFILLYIKL